MKSKIVLEITSIGWSKIVYRNGKEFKRVEWQLNSTGAKSISGDLENDEEVSDELYDALDNLDGYQVARYLESEEAE